MAVVISSSMVLSDTVSGGGTINTNNPLIGYQNLVTSTNIVSDTEDADHPVTNLANPSTNLKWIGEVSSPEEDEHITITVNTSEDIDYVGIARHNFGSAQITVSVEILDASASPDEWVEVVQETLMGTDEPIILRFDPQPASQIRVRLQPGTEAPTAAVLYVGKLLVLQRRLYVGHSPITYAKMSKVTNAKSESGEFLGRIVLNQMSKTSVALANLTPAWFRTYLAPFIASSKENPFFFAWRPGSYPREVGYAWLTNDPVPNNQRSNGMMQISMEMGGIG